MALVFIKSMETVIKTLDSFKYLNNKVDFMYKFQNCICQRPLIQEALNEMLRFVTFISVFPSFTVLTGKGGVVGLFVCLQLINCFKLPG